MNGREFAKFIKEQAKLNGVEGHELEGAVGTVLTETVKQRAAATNDPVEATKMILILFATIMKCFSITPEMLADPQTTKILNKIGEVLDNLSPSENENLQ